MNRRTTLPAGLFVALACVTICGYFWFNRSRPSVRLTYKWPHATRRAIDDTVVQAVWQNLVSCNQISKIIAFSTDGQADIYITGTAGANFNKLLVAVTERLPADSQLPVGVAPEGTILPTSDTPPTAETVSSKAEFNFSIDHEKAKTAGLTLSEAQSELCRAMLSAPPEDALKGYRTTPIRLPNGKSVPLDQIATIETHQMVNPIIRTYP